MAQTREIQLRSKVVFNPNQRDKGESGLVEKLHRENQHRYPLTVHEKVGEVIPSLKDKDGQPVYPTGDRSSHTVFRVSWLMLWEEGQ